jgi:hypothetical protein
MGRLRDQMAVDLRLRNFSPATQRNYLLYARRFAAFFMRSPLVWPSLLKCRRMLYAFPAIVSWKHICQRGGAGAGIQRSRGRLPGYLLPLRP